MPHTRPAWAGDRVDDVSPPCIHGLESQPRSEMLKSFKIGTDDRHVIGNVTAGGKVTAVPYQNGVLDTWM